MLADPQHDFSAPGFCAASSWLKLTPSVRIWSTTLTTLSFQKISRLKVELVILFFMDDTVSPFSTYQTVLYFDITLSTIFRNYRRLRKTPPWVLAPKYAWSSAPQGASQGNIMLGWLFNKVPYEICHRGKLDLSWCLTLIIFFTWEKWLPLWFLTTGTGFSFE